MGLWAYKSSVTRFGKEEVCNAIKEDIGRDALISGGMYIEVNEIDADIRNGMLVEMETDWEHEEAQIWDVWRKCFEPR